MRICHSSLDAEFIASKDIDSCFRKNNTPRLRRNRAPDRDAYYCHIGIMLAKIGIKNDAVIRAFIRTYADSFNTADGDGVYPDEANLITGFEELRYNQTL